MQNTRQRPASLSQELAELAQRGLDDADADRLRMLTLTNAAAAIGEQGRASELIARRPFDADSPAGRAFRDGMRLHARTQDDFFPAGRVHVGAISLAVALALADRSGGRLLEPLAAGYRVLCAVSRAYAPVAQARGYRPSGIFGPLGAAACAAVALDLDRTRVANAIGLAAARAAGTNQSWIAGTDEWMLEVGFAARSGVEAALLTEAGFAAAPDAIEGDAGWARAYLGDDGAAQLAQTLARPERSIAAVAVKPFPVSGIAQVPTELACRAHALLDGRRPDSIALGMSEAELAYPGTTSAGPFASRSDTLMSAAWCVAAGLADGAVKLGRLEQPNGLAELVGRVQVRGEPAFADGEAELTVVAGGERHRLRGAAAEVLFPAWDDAATQVAAIADRSEAPAAVVEGIYAALGEEAPDARTVRDLMEQGK